MNMELEGIIILFAGASLLSALFMMHAARRTKIKHDAIKAYAEQNQYLYEYVPSQNSSGSRVLVKDPDNVWVMTMYFNSGSSNALSLSSGGIKHWSEWSCAEGNLSDGYAVLGPKLPEKTIKMPNVGTMGPLGDVFKRLMFQFTKGMGVDLDECKLQESNKDNPSGAVLATHGQENDSLFEMNPTQNKKHIRFDSGHLLPEGYYEKISGWF
ncbi:hypothetical protein [Glaciecola sp. 1036]|uniref:hypothetical protein n=1 Tax=Alteromonadaceae TaxID=72275 RepID=UPI003D066E21